jgi:hypothetical protein
MWVMKIEVVSFDEESGTAEVDADEEGRQYLLELGFNALIKRALDMVEAGHEREAGKGV